MLDVAEAKLGNSLQHRQSEATQQHLDLIGDKLGAGDGDDVPEHVRHNAEQFNRFYRTFGVPNGARLDWLATSHWPLQYFMAASVMYATAFSLRAATFIYGAQELSAALRIRMQSIGSASCGSTLLSAVLVWFLGPSYIDRPPTRVLALVVLTLSFILMCTLYFPPLFAPEDRVPFQSRFIFLLLMAPTQMCDHFIGTLTFVTNERAPPEARMWKVLTRAGVKTLRGMDAFSDIIYMRVLWEKVRPPVPRVRHFACCSNGLVSDLRKLPHLNHTSADGRPWCP